LVTTFENRKIEGLRQFVLVAADGNDGKFGIRQKQAARTDQVGQQRTLAASGCISVRCIGTAGVAEATITGDLEARDAKPGAGVVEENPAARRKETDVKASLGKFASLVSSSLKRISFATKQRLLPMVLDTVVVNDWKVDVHYNIPTAKTDSNPRATSVSPIRFTFHM
jgi:hypothetical protein